VTQQVTIDVIDFLAFVPAVSVIFHAASTAPAGFLKANGAAVSRTTYAALFAALGTSYGAGEGTTTFNLPDLRGQFLRGFDDGAGVDSGRVFGSAQTDALQGHEHTQRWSSGSYGTTSGGSGLTPLSGATTGIVTDGVNGTPRTAAETRPKNIALLACIKY
jgi:phage-related tail fiber protein